MQKKRDEDAYAEQLIQELRQAKPELIKMTPQLVGISKLIDAEMEEAKAIVQKQKQRHPIENWKPLERF